MLLYIYSFHSIFQILFYLDVFNKILSINEKKILILFDKEQNIWFCYKNLLEALEYIDTKDAIKKLKIDRKYLMKINELKEGGWKPPPLIYSLIH